MLLTIQKLTNFKYFLTNKSDFVVFDSCPYCGSKVTRFTEREIMFECKQTFIKENSCHGWEQEEYWESICTSIRKSMKENARNNKFIVTMEG